MCSCKGAFQGNPCLQGALSAKMLRLSACCRPGNFSSFRSHPEKTAFLGRFATLSTRVPWVHAILYFRLLSILIRKGQSSI
jgi:hypothetical protein